ncbi:MAG: GNAT family N-acetyltransferase [Bacilli bacterium]
MSVEFCYFNESDYQSVCDFLIALNQRDRSHINWNWARWEWMYSHPYFDGAKKNTIGLWKDNHKVVGVAIYDLYYGEAFCEALSQYNYLLPEIIKYAYQNFCDDEGIQIAINDDDNEMKSLLIKQGYVKTENTETVMRLEPFQANDYFLPDGFSFHEIDLIKDNMAYQTVIWKGFDHEGDMEELHKMINNPNPLPPHLQKNLCLAIMDKDGNFVSHCAFWFDKRTDYAYIEPLCTIPTHRHQGFAKILLLELINRCYQMKIKDIFVISTMDFYKKMEFKKYATYTFYGKKR